MLRPHIRASAVALLASALVLAGCTAPPSPPTSAATDVATDTATVDPTDPEPAVREVPDPPVAPVGGGLGAVGEFPVRMAKDIGPRPHATGDVVTGADGTTPGAYIVAADDVFDTIASRFGFDIYYLTAINQVRRGPFGAALYAGDTINLDAHTILSVGTINGEVNDFDAPDPIPAQR